MKDEQIRPEKNPHAVALGSLGGKRRAELLDASRKVEIATQGAPLGGKARAESLSKTQRSAIAKKAAEVRWAKAKERALVDLTRTPSIK